ncbi:phosphoribosyltransferase family protein [Synergistes jonesii]|uniref:Transcriptional regulator n=1 Tax=Synergistes jonesii TaxID=2754 RepID=A0A073ILZ3_9BACT|nr:phosphoribosyltransferase family protein [Synergistes jonesii]KEJ91353.1 transcriptional regulator [Synergistes jonesii]OFB60418.1 transcriptional regulator [Synergistes jonesii]OFB61243.1 transcriptional regulator [Synergistes jonesii]OFB62874.1 transcriptional regulator [Synergistes jonesii]OFB66629.1 transcriptional regulator [Synergistes jonesii]
MRGQRTERLVRLAAKFMLSPSKLISLTDLANKFNVSKTVISDDVEVINSAMEEEGFGQMQVDRGRSGGARFIPLCTPQYRDTILSEIAVRLSDPERNLPGGLIYYSDLIFNPETALTLGYCMASLFTETEPDVVMTSEVKGIPVAMFAAYALGVPLAVCRFRNRPSDGAAVGVHYPTANGDVKTMYIGTRQLQQGARVLIVDDFMRGGSTASGMLLMAKQFEAEVTGVGVFIAYDEPKIKSVPNYRSLLTLHNMEGENRLSVTKQKD